MLVFAALLPAFVPAFDPAFVPAFVPHAAPFAGLLPASARASAVVAKAAKRKAAAGKRKPAKPAAFDLKKAMLVAMRAHQDLWRLDPQRSLCTSAPIARVSPQGVPPPPPQGV